MRVFERLMIGTANFGQAPYGHRGVVCPRSEQEDILSYCMSAGIDTLHTKDEYGVDLSWIPTYFRVVNATHEGVSAYDPGDVPCRDPLHPYDWINIPYSPFNRTWEAWMSQWYSCFDEIHVRSIFVQGKVFTSDEPVFVRFRKYARELGLPPGTLCMLFCLLNPAVDRVVIGVDSVAQLRENLRFFHRLDGFATEDAQLIDPRKWGATE